MTEDPDEYPAECSISAEELTELKEALTTNEDWKSYVEEWPPTDINGNVYPIWFTVDDLNVRGELIDSRGNNYNPFAGNLVPTEHRTEKYYYCNAPLHNWRERYPNIRYCATVVNPDLYDEYCYIHEGAMKSAEEHMQSGLFTKTVDHMYEKLSPWKQLLGWGIYEGLLGESEYEFGIEYEQKEFDFSDEDYVPVTTNDDDVLVTKVSYPTQYIDPALSLYNAAMLRVQALHVQPRILETNRDEGKDVMESKTVEKAQLTAPPSEFDQSPQEFKTLETWSEHHLNVPFSRLFKDMEKALKRGGVIIDPEAESDDSISGEDIVLAIDADGETVETVDDTGTDPNAFGDNYTSQSQEIKDHIEEHDSDE